MENRSELEGVNDKYPEDFSGVIVRVFTSAYQPEFDTGKNLGHVSLEIVIEGIPGHWDNGTYISFGPSGTPIESITKEEINDEDSKENVLDSEENLRPHNFPKRHGPKFVLSYKDDLLKVEQREPEFTFVFHELDRSAIISHIIHKLRPPNEPNYSVAFGQFSFGVARESLWKSIWSKATSWLYKQDTQKTRNFDQAKEVNESTYSCVSMVYEILYNGGIGNLLSLDDKILAHAVASLRSVNESQEAFQNLNAELFSKALGYSAENVLHPIFINPDLFAEYMKIAKINEMQIGRRDKIIENEWIPEYESE